MSDSCEESENNCDENLRPHFRSFARYKWTYNEFVLGLDLIVFKSLSDSEPLIFARTF